jgi:chromosome segregation ATPase
MINEKTLAAYEEAKARDSEYYAGYRAGTRDTGAEANQNMEGMVRLVETYETQIQENNQTIQELEAQKIAMTQAGDAVIYGLRAERATDLIEITRLQNQLGPLWSGLVDVRAQNAKLQEMVKEATSLMGEAAETVIATKSIIAKAEELLAQYLNARAQLPAPEYFMEPDQLWADLAPQVRADWIEEARRLINAEVS